MAGILIAGAGIFLILSATAGYAAAYQYMKKRKRRIKEEIYQIYD